MKRSKVIQLLLLGTGVISLTACDDKKKTAEQYTDEQACLKVHTPEECKKALQESRAKHLASSPKFTSKEECEKQFGADKCVAAPTEHAAHHGGGMFMPMMMGFMMGKMMGGGTPILPTSPSATGGWSSASKGPQSTTQRGGFGAASRGYSVSS